MSSTTNGFAEIAEESFTSIFNRTNGGMGVAETTKTNPTIGRTADQRINKRNKEARIKIK